MRHLVALTVGVVLLPTWAFAQQQGVQTTPGVVNNPLFPSGNPFNPTVPTLPVAPHAQNNGNGNGNLTMQDIMRLRMMQSMMGGRRNPPKYGAGGMAPRFYGGYQNPNFVPFAQPPAPVNGMPAMDAARAARDAEKARAKQRADEIRAKEAEARERRKAKLLEEKAAREGLQAGAGRPQPEPSKQAAEKDGNDAGEAN